MSTTTETPRNADGENLCAWCGKGPVPPSRGTKPRAYCSRSCVQRAHEARKEAARVDEKLKERMWAVYMKGRREEAEAWESGAKSRDVPTPRAKSRDFPEGDPAKSRDFPLTSQVTPPEPPDAGDGWVRSVEEIDAQIRDLEQRRAHARRAAFGEDGPHPA